MASSAPLLRQLKVQLSTGLSYDLAKDLTGGHIKSGSTIPAKQNITESEKLYKCVPTGIIACLDKCRSISALPYRLTTPTATGDQ